MCNLNILIRKNIENKKIMKFIYKTTSNSFKHNPDGEGFFCPKGNLLVKSEEKINYSKYKKNLKESPIIITHQRISTSGYEVKYNQPFKSSEFILIHNGVINEFLGKNGSDTYGFFNQFVKIFNKSKGKREEKIIKAIKKLLDKLDYGSFSIALYDRITKDLYYFKNESTSIHFFKSKNLFYITTILENEQFLPLLNEKFDEINVKDYKIYKINKDLNIKIVGKIKKSERQYNFWENYNPYQNYKQNVFVIPKNQEYAKKKYPKRNIILADLKECEYCGQLTSNLDSETFERVCDDCLDWEKETGCKIPAYV